MTLRERIADWISGGRYRLYKWHSLRLMSIVEELDDANERLDRIAVQETSKANGTVKRMARIARGEE